MECLGVNIKEKKKRLCDCGRHSEHGPISLYYVALHWGLDIWETSWEVGNSLLQGSESILHVLQQLGVVSFYLCFTILDRILNDTWKAQNLLRGLMINMANQTSPATWETNVYLELHGADLVQDLPHVFPDDGPGDFVVTLSCGLHRMSGHVIKRYHVWEDANSFVEGAKPKRIFTHMLFNTFSCFHGNYSNIIKYNIQNAQLQESACSFKTFNVICLNVSALYSPVIGSITILLQVVVLNELSNF